MKCFVNFLRSIFTTEHTEVVDANDCGEGKPLPENVKVVDGDVLINDAYAQTTSTDDDSQRVSHTR